MELQIAGWIILTYALCYHSLTAFILWCVISFYLCVIRQTEIDWNKMKEKEVEGQNDKKE